MATDFPPGGMAGMSQQQIAAALNSAAMAQARTTATGSLTTGIGLSGGAQGLYDPTAANGIQFYSGTLAPGTLSSQIWPIPHTKTEPAPYDREEPDDALERAWLEKHGPALLPLAMAFYRHVVPHAVSCLVDADEDQRCRENVRRRAMVCQALSNLRDMQALMNMGAGKVEELQSYLLDALDEMDQDPWFTKAKLFVSFHPLENYIVTMFDAASELSDQAAEALDALGERGLSGSEFFKQSMKFVVASVRIAS